VHETLPSVVLYQKPNGCLGTHKHVFISAKAGNDKRRLWAESTWPWFFSVPFFKEGCRTYSEDHFSWKSYLVLPL